MQSTGRTDNEEPVAAASGGLDADGTIETWVVFLVDEQKYALQIDEVERIVRAVEVKPLPQSPPHVLGIINLQGRVIPVINLRKLLRRPERDLRLEDHFIVARSSTITAILPVDAALGSLEVVDTSELPDAKARDRYLRKIVPVNNEVVYTLDLDRIVLADRDPTESDLATLMAEVQDS